MSTQGPLPEFENPPVVEVAIGTFFRQPTSLSNAHLGKYWSRIENRYPIVRDVDPVVMTTEDADGASQIAPELPVPRLWMMDSKEEFLVQVQRNAFFLNWRRGTQAGIYPRFEAIYSKFRSEWREFALLISEVGDSSVTHELLELTYVNHVPDGSIVPNGQTPSDVLADVRAEWDQKKFLPRPDRLALQTSYPLPGRGGRLYVQAQTAIARRTKEPLISLSLSVKGRPDANADLTEIGNWYLLAHEWIVRGFADVISDRARKVWGETSAIRK